MITYATAYGITYATTYGITYGITYGVTYAITYGSGLIQLYFFMNLQKKNAGLYLQERGWK